MAGWSMVADGSVVDCVKTTSKEKNIEPDGDRVDRKPRLKDSGPESDKLCSSFDPFLRVFLKEICPQDNYLVLPPMLGDGRPVDLFKLFLVVREKGGYGRVTQNGSWGLVAKESGLDSSIATAVKLVYVKYLDALERCLERAVVDDKKVTESNFSDSGLSLRGRLMELGAKFNVLLADSKKIEEALENVNSELNLVNECKDDVNEVESLHIDSTKRFSKSSEIGKSRDDGLEKTTVLDLQMSKNGSDVEVDVHFDDVDVAKCIVNSPNLKGLFHDEELKKAHVVETDTDKEIAMIVGPRVEEKESLSHNEKRAERSKHKRKRDSTWKLLSWVTGIAKGPCDAVIGSLPDKSKWKSYANEELWKQVLSYREAVFLKRNVDPSSEQSIGQKNQKMHSCMYDDHIGISYNLRERLSCGKKTCQAGDSSMSSPLSAKSDSDKRGMENCADKALRETTDSPTPYSVFDHEVEKQIPVGSAFQAELPEWTGVPSPIDFKWLGTQVWPLQKVEHKFFIERDPMGKGREDACGCQFRGSVECVRFHIAEKRYRLKLELGSAFQNWKFDKMGEEVRLSWTDEEQNKFKNIVRSNPPSLEKRFWDLIVKFFPSKSREQLVSYYFDVFLLQRRALQNRSVPCEIDSDDDCESEYGSVAHTYVHETMKSPSSIFHSPNKKHKQSK